MKPEWTNAKDEPGTITMPDDDAKTVNNYLQWLGSREVPIRLEADDQVPVFEIPVRDIHRVQVALARAWIFGDKILDAKYKNAIFTILSKDKQISRFAFSPAVVNLIYENTPDGSPLRRYNAEWEANRADLDSSGRATAIECFELYSEEAVLDVLKAMVRVRPAPNKKDFDLESFFEKE